ncbi:hypothetical protein IFM89_011958 [Coptis chinensis]|uniref:Uncharacterized protein n=1 Tax=Coptis chinensis TaxID=261450 RepID=A0A835LEW0_9MAGN|nr:hypothetical protein IFM89_011958 [Coptis chinensis]
MSQTGSDQPSDYQLDSEPSDSEEIEEQHTGPKKQVRFNYNGLPIGPGSTQFVTFIGKIARMYCAPTYANWPIVPEDIKKHVFKRVTDEIKRLVSLDPYLGEKDLDNDPVAKGRVRGLGTGVTKTVVHASTPYIKIVEEEKRKRESTDENVKLVMQRLDEETRARKILGEKLEGYTPKFENTSP